MSTGRRDQETRRHTESRVDWLAILLELGRLGYSTYALATALRIPRATLMGWKNSGVEPKHGDGEAVLALWSRIVGRPVAEAPRTNAPRWLG